MEEEEKVNFYPPQMGTGAEKDTKGEKKDWGKRNVFRGGTFKEKTFSRVAKVRGFCYLHFPSTYLQYSLSVFLFR